MDDRGRARGSDAGQARLTLSGARGSTRDHAAVRATDAPPPRSRTALRQRGSARCALAPATRLPDPSGRRANACAKPFLFSKLLAIIALDSGHNAAISAVVRHSRACASLAVGKVAPFWQVHYWHADFLFPDVVDFYLLRCQESQSACTKGRCCCLHDTAADAVRGQPRNRRKVF